MLSSDDDAPLDDIIATFASVASHDLRNSLATLHGFLDLVVEEEQLGELGTHLMGRAFDVADRMGTLVDAIGEYGRARRRELAPHRLPADDVADVVGLALGDLGGSLVADATIEIGSLPTVHGDPGALRDALSQVLDNALRYRREDHAPTLHVRGSTSGDRAIIEVEDDGPGLPEGTETAMFQPFSKTINSRGHNRTGLGLAIALVLVERSGGTMRAETVDPEAGGTRVTIELPAG